MAETRLTPDVDLDGLAPDEAFAILGNELRLDIVRALWRAGAAREYDDISDAARTIPFSELRRRVDVDDNGKFNYHLSRLAPHFVKRTDEGYRLSGAGKQIARTVIAISGAEDVDLGAELGWDCPLCDAPVTAAYEDQWLRVQCTECDGLFGDGAPTGMVFLSSYPGAALRERRLDEAVATGFYRCMLDIAYMMRDVCRECAGPISASVSVCDGHESGSNEACPRCGTRFPVWAELRCDACRFAKRLPVEPFVLGLTPVIGLLDELGIDALAPSFEEIIDLLHHRLETTVAESPFRVSVTVEGDGRTLEVTLDADLDVVAVDRRRSD